MQCITLQQNTILYWDLFCPQWQVLVLLAEQVASLHPSTYFCYLTPSLLTYLHPGYISPYFTVYLNSCGSIYCSQLQTWATYVGFDVLTEVVMKNSILWEKTQLFLCQFIRWFILSIHPKVLNRRFLTWSWNRYEFIYPIWLKLKVLLKPSEEENYFLRKARA
jgi:hypothetical protein